MRRIMWKLSFVSLATTQRRYVKKNAALSYAGAALGHIRKAPSTLRRCVVARDKKNEAHGWKQLAKKLKAPKTIILLCAITGCGEAPREAAAEGGGRLDPALILGEMDSEGFERAFEPREFRFPEDHGPHPGFRNEWWYLTGNVETAEGRRFGYQVTFFRNALAPPEEPPPGPLSAWRGNDVWMAHAALTDAGGERHYALERFSRENPGLAGARAEPFEVWLETWRLFSPTGGGPWQLDVETEDFSLALALDPLKQPVLQGENGLSRKSAEPGNASYYYSLTRLATQGEVVLAGRAYAVEGLSWLDREWSTSALAPDQSGWDWFSLQFDDGSELMYYQLRDRRGDAHPFSRGNRTTPAGAQRAMQPGEVALMPLQSWTSPYGVDYTTAWRLQHGGDEWLIRALLEQQLMDLSVRYWEGAVEVLDADSGVRVGRGYLERVRSGTGR